jgi:hypothetical protein
LVTTAVTPIEKMAATAREAAMAGGIMRRGRRDSSPSVADASNPAKVENMKTIPRPSTDSVAPSGRNGAELNACPWKPPLARTMLQAMVTSSIETPSSTKISVAEILMSA